MSFNVSSTGLPKIHVHTAIPVAVVTHQPTKQHEHTGPVTPTTTAHVTQTHLGKNVDRTV